MFRRIVIKINEARLISLQVFDVNSKPHIKRKAPVSGRMPATAQCKILKTETDAENSDHASSMSSTQAPRFQIPTLSDSEEEQEEEEAQDSSVGLKKLHEENAALRNRLEHAEGKFEVMATTMSKVHGVIEPLTTRTSEAIRTSNSARSQPPGMRRGDIHPVLRSANGVATR